MLDVHNHLLWGIDDGCRNPEETTALAEGLVAAGHQGVVVTPHIRPGMFDNTPEKIRARFDEARPIIEAAGLELFLGAECFCVPELIQQAKEGRLLTLAGSRYLLVEFSSAQLPPRWEELLYELRVAGVVPVIAHPERCLGIREDLEGVLEVAERLELLLQLDTGSLIGRYGHAAQLAAERLLKAKAYHLAACDAHRPKDLKRLVFPSLKRLSRRLGLFGNKAREAALLVDNPRRIVEDAPRDSIQPV